MLNALPPEIQVLLLSMLPVLELRFAIPFGIAALGMSPLSAFLWALAGNWLVTVFILWGLDPISSFLRKHSPFMKRFTDWLFERTRKKHKHRISELGHLALLIFVAVPLPGTGSWTGSLISYLFGVEKKTALLWITPGLVVAGFLMTFGTSGVIEAIQWALGE